MKRIISAFLILFCLNAQALVIDNGVTIINASDETINIKLQIGLVSSYKTMRITDSDGTRNYTVEYSEQNLILPPKGAGKNYETIDMLPKKFSCIKDSDVCMTSKTLTVIEISNSSTSTKFGNAQEFRKYIKEHNTGNGPWPVYCGGSGNHTIIIDNFGSDRFFCEMRRET